MEHGTCDIWHCVKISAPKLNNFGVVTFWRFGGKATGTKWKKLTGVAVRRQKILRLSNSMTWFDQNCPMKGTYFAMIFLPKKFVKFCDIFKNSSFIYLGYNTAYITYYEELLSNYLTIGHALSNNWTIGHTLSNHWTAEQSLEQNIAWHYLNFKYVKGFYRIFKT